MIRISKAKKDEMETVRGIAFKTWPSAYGEILSESQLNYMLDKIYSHESLIYQQEVLGHQFIIVKENDDAIGFASFSAHADNNIFHLNKIYVLPGQQGKNIGKQILDYIISEIKKNGAMALQLNVNRHNNAVNFYQKQGFKIIRTEDIDIGEGYFMNDYVMEKLI